MTSAATKIGPYEIVGTLGSGGMSSVSLARAPTGDLVVLKRQHHVLDDEALRDEARVGVRLMHPSIVETLDLVEHAGRPVLVVAYVSGATLADLRATGPLPVEIVLRLGRQIAEALSIIHTAVDEDGSALKIVHRDVTPSNIMLGHDGQARLIDLGIARSAVQRRERTQAGYLKGTLRYLAPEVLKGGAATPGSDLWALGMSLREAALGKLSMDGSDVEIFAAIVDGRLSEPKPGEVLDPRVAHCVGHLLRMNPLHRPPSAADAARIFRTFGAAFEDDEVDEAARALVLHAVGDEARLGDRQPHAAELVVNRAAATFGGPMGDWRVASAFASNPFGRAPSSQSLPFPHVDLAGFRADGQGDGHADVTEELSPVELAAAARRRGTEVPAPVFLGAAPPAIIDADHEAQRTEVLSIDEARLRAREVAARYQELAEHDSWLAEETVAEMDRAGPQAVTDPDDDADPTNDE